MATFEYVKNPELSSLWEEYPGNKLRGRRYYNDEPRSQPGFKEMVRFAFAGNPQRKEKKADPFRPRLIETTAFVEDDRDMLVWFGHAAFFLRLQGVSMFIDPCLMDLPFIARRVGLPCAIEEVTGLDYILLSHGHRDHLDMPSLKRLRSVNDSFSFLTGLGVGSLLQRFKPAGIQEAGWYQRFALPHDDLEIAYMPAIHWNRRGLTDFNLMLWGGFLFRTPDVTIFFTGDTAYGPHFQTIKEVVGEIDLCIMPIGAYKPDYVMKSSHVNPEESVQAFRELGGETFVPMHYGTYDLSNEPFGEPIERIKQFHREGELPGELRELAVGEIMYL